MSKTCVHCELTGADLLALVRRLKKAQMVEGGLGPTEYALLQRFELMLPSAPRPLAEPEDPHHPSLWDV
jgi:hypothetical protein